MAITVTLPVETVSGLNASIEPGGSLDPNTTYYYIVVAYDNQYISPASGRLSCHSPISEEKSFTTTTSGLSAHITWSNASGASNYQVLVTTTSGNYTNTGGFGTIPEGIGTTMTDGPTGYTVTALSTETWMFHSIQMVNNLPNNLSKEIGTIRVEFTGEDTYDLDDVYDAIVSAGYSDYVYYDGFNFTLKGWLTATSHSDSGSLVVEKKRITFIKGGIQIYGCPNYEMRFGRWISETVGADYMYGCSIDAQNSRYPILAGYDNIKFYGSLVSHGFSKITTQAENLSNAYYTGGSQQYFYQNTENFRDSILGGAFRGNSSDVYDLKFGQGNNFSNVNHVRCKITNTANMPYSAGLGFFYSCDIYDTVLNYYTFRDGNPDWTAMYDCSFPLFSASDYKATAPYMRFSNLASDYLYSPNYWDIYYSVVATVLDSYGYPLSNVEVNIVDKDNNNVTIIEHDDTYDRITTGTTYDGVVSTDGEGKIDYYIQSYKTYHNPENTAYTESYDSLTDYYYPFKITFSKNGYESYTVTLNELLERTELLVTLSQTPEESIPFLPLPSGYTGELTGPLSPEGGIGGDNPLGGELQVNIGLDEIDLRNAIHGAYMGKEVNVPETVVEGQTVRVETVTKLMSEVLDSVGQANTKLMAEAFAEEIVSHIKDYAATVGATDEILFINSNVQSVIDGTNSGFDILGSFCAGLPGGQGLTTSMQTVTQALNAVKTDLADKNSTNMSNNID